MNIKVNLPQLVELNDRIEGLHYAIQRLDKKIDTLALAVVAPGPVQLDLPLAEKLKNEAPAPKPRGRRRKTPEVEVIDAKPVNGENGVDHDENDDEDTLRARAAFEIKRAQRILGVGTVRAVIKKVAGANIINVDDLSVKQLPTLLTELQAL